MKEFSATTTINASAEKIWSVLTDVAQWSDWEPNVTKVEGAVAQGSKITVHTTISDRAFPVTVSELVTNKKMVWSSGMPLGLFKGARTFTLTDLGDGNVRVDTHERFEGILLPIIGRTIPDLSETFQQFSTALKARAESS